MYKWRMHSSYVELNPAYDIGNGDIKKLLDHIAGLSKEEIVEEAGIIEQMIEAHVPNSSERDTIQGALLSRELELNVYDADKASKIQNSYDQKKAELQKQHDTAQAAKTAKTLDNPSGDYKPFVTTSADPNDPTLYHVTPATDEHPARVKEFANFDIVQWRIIQGKQEHSSEITIRHLKEGALGLSSKKIEQKVIKLNASALSNLSALRRSIVRVFNGAIINEVGRSQTTDLNMFVRYLNTLTPVIELAKDFYGFDADDNGEIFFHHGNAQSQQKESRVLTADGKEIDHNIIYKGASFKALWSIPEIDKAKETLELFLSNYSRMYNFGKAFAVLGWMCSGIIHQKLRSISSDYQHPILYMWGPADIGKSTLVRNLFKVFGWAGVDGKSEEYIFSGSNATNRDILTAYNVPIIVGEFRNAFANAEEMVRTLLAVYDGMTSGKKIKTEGEIWEQDSVPYRAALAILSNNVITDQAARSRFLEIQAAKQDIPTGENHNCYKAIGNMAAGSIGAIFIRWVLNNWQQIEQIVDKIDADIAKYDIEGRSKNILRAVAYGLNIFDKMALEYGVDAQKLIGYNMTDIYTETCKLIDTKEQSSDDADFCRWIVDEINSSQSSITNWTSYEDKHTKHLIFVCEKKVIETYLRRNGMNQKINNAIKEFKESIKQHSDVYKIGHTRALNTTLKTESSNTERLIIDATVACKKYGIQDISAFMKTDLSLGNLVILKNTQ